MSLSTSFSNAGDVMHHQAKGKGMLYTVLRLLKIYLKPNIQWKHCINGCDKGLTQEIVTTATAVTSTMQTVEYHVKYNTTTDQTHLKQTTVVVGGKDKPRKKSTIVVTSTTLRI
jgi:hypothetical protein